MRTILFAFFATILINTLVYSQQNCLSFSTTNTIKDANSSRSISDNCELNVYPNPARDYIILNYKVEKSDSRIDIYDLRGKTYFSKNITEKEGEILIETNNFVSGSYFVKLQSEGKVIKTEKINIIK